MNSLARKKNGIGGGIWLFKIAITINEKTLLFCLHYILIHHNYETTDGVNTHYSYSQPCPTSTSEMESPGHPDKKEEIKECYSWPLNRTTLHLSTTGMQSGSDITWKAKIHNKSRFVELSRRCTYHQLSRIKARTRKPSTITVIPPLPSRITLYKKRMEGQRNKKATPTTKATTSNLCWEHLSKLSIFPLSFRVVYRRLPGHRHLWFILFGFNRGG